MVQQLFSAELPARCAQCRAFRRVLVLTDASSNSAGLRAALSDYGCQVEAAAASEQAFESIDASDYEFVVWDTWRPQAEESTALRRFRRRCAQLPLLALVDGARSETAIELTRAGASELLAKPYTAAALRQAVARCLQSRRVFCDAVAMPGVQEPCCAVPRLVGRGALMQEVYKQIGLVAERDEAVMVRGETGTGKELVARAIHQYSPRKDRPLVAVNCAAIPEALLESELFGHERGSFTGAIQRRLGAFEHADGGTLFLDEIGDMPLPLQAKILRALQQKEIQRVGGNERVPVDVRVVAATNQTLESAIAAGTFREDLYYRLQVVLIQLPALREHPEDIRELAEYFIARYTPPGEPRPALDARAVKCLENYPWPGNVRELENAIRRALVVAKGRVILESDLHLAGPLGRGGPDSGVASPAAPTAEEELDRSLRTWLAQQAKCQADAACGSVADRMEAMLLQAALRQTHGNQARASRVLGISRATLRNWLKKHNLPSDAAAWE